MGSDVIKTVELRVLAKNDIGGGMRDVRVNFLKSIDQLEKEAYEKGKGIRGTLDRLSASIGKSSDLKGILEVVKGGGAVAGLSLAGGMLADITGNLRDMQVQLQLNEKSAGEVTEQFLKQIPIVGNLWTAGRNIREMWDGTAVAVAKANKEAEATIATMKIVKDLLAEGKKQVREIGRSSEQTQLKAAIKEVDRLHLIKPFDVIIKAKMSFDDDAKKQADDLARAAKERTELALKTFLESTAGKEYQKSLAEALPSPTIKKVATDPNGNDFTYDAENPAFKAASDLRNSLDKQRDMALKAADDVNKLVAEAAAVELSAKKREFKANVGISIEGASGIEGWTKLALRAKSTLVTIFDPAVRRFEASISRSSIGPGVVRLMRSVADVMPALERQHDIRRDLMTITVGALRASINDGRVDLEIEAKKLEIHRKYVDEWRELVRIRDSIDATDDQRSQARQLLATRQQREELEKQKVVYDALRAATNFRQISVSAGVGVTQQLAITQQFERQQQNRLTQMMERVAATQSIGVGNGASTGGTEIVKALSLITTAINLLMTKLNGKELRTVRR
jgi:hypothetical protein